ncbi:MAG: DUF945 domain-containing protein [Clostridium sp.]|nr:DUF945 domain-containing protein [Clostridium sp.]
MYLATPENYSDYGFSSLGNSVGFPAPFVKGINGTNAALAKNIVHDRINHYFKMHPDKPLTARKYTVDGKQKIYGVVSNTYSFFDDDEVMDIIGSSPLAGCRYKNVHVSPERLHLRAVESEPFYLPEDTSPMYYAYFIDNSMVGAASFRILLGLYRQVCSNGMILSVKKLTLCRQIHRGTKDIAAEFNASLEFLKEKKEDVKQILLTATAVPSALEDMNKEFQTEYLAKKLTMSKKEAEKVIVLYDNYSLQYGSRSQWALANAITEYARDIKDIQRREFLESRALQVA